MISRCQFIFGALASGAALATGYWPDDGLLNSCLDPAQLDDSVELKGDGGIKK